MLVDVRVLDTNGGRTSALLLPIVDLLEGSLLEGGLGRSRSGGLSLLFDQGWQRLRKRLSCLRQHDSILWALGPGETRFDAGKIKTQQLGVFGFRRVGIVK